MKGLHSVAFILLIVGGLNWLLVGLVHWEIGDLIGGMSAPLARLIYVLVGLSAIVEIINHKSLCKNCSKMGEHPATSTM